MVMTSGAQQTNASIEGARAAEAGNGYSVVAKKVKEMAKEAGSETDDLNRKIKAIHGFTTGAVEAIAQIRGVINEINDISNTVTPAGEELTATTNETAHNGQEAARGGSHVAENIIAGPRAAKCTTQNASDTQIASGELARMAVDLQKIASQFKYNKHDLGTPKTGFRDMGGRGRVRGCQTTSILSLFRLQPVSKATKAAAQVAEHVEWDLP